MSTIWSAIQAMFDSALDVLGEVDMLLIAHGTRGISANAN